QKPKFHAFIRPRHIHNMRRAAQIIARTGITHRHIVNMTKKGLYMHE
ncbi:hypothetical protein C5S39_07960, partial [Candidatus Methanophagaceae archaeon]